MRGAKRPVSGGTVALRAMSCVRRGARDRALRICRQASGRVGLAGVAGGWLRRSAMNWSNSALSRAMRSRPRKSLELALLLLEAAQRLRAVLVEGAVAARRRRGPSRQPPPAAFAPPMRSRRRSILPCRRLIRCSYRSAPAYPQPMRPLQNSKGQGRQTQRPPHDEAENREGDPGSLPIFVQLRDDRHVPPLDS